MQFIFWNEKVAKVSEAFYFKLHFQPHYLLSYCGTALITSDIILLQLIVTLVSRDSSKCCLFYLSLEWLYSTSHVKTRNGSAAQCSAAQSLSLPLSLKHKRLHSPVCATTHTFSRPYAYPPSQYLVNGSSLSILTGYMYIWMCLDACVITCRDVFMTTAAQLLLLAMRTSCVYSHIWVRKVLILIVTTTITTTVTDGDDFCSPPSSCIITELLTSGRDYEVVFRRNFIYNKVLSIHELPLYHLR